MDSGKIIMTHIINFIALPTISFSHTDGFFGRVNEYPVYSFEIADS
jgi:hypothetical protein